MLPLTDKKNEMKEAAPDLFEVDCPSEGVYVKLKFLCVLSKYLQKFESVLVVKSALYKNIKRFLEWAFQKCSMQVKTTIWQKALARKWTIKFEWSEERNEAVRDKSGLAVASRWRKIYEDRSRKWSLLQRNSLEMTLDKRLLLNINGCSGDASLET